MGQRMSFRVCDQLEEHEDSIILGTRNLKEERSSGLLSAEKYPCISALSICDRHLLRRRAEQAARDSPKVL